MTRPARVGQPSVLVIWATSGLTLAEKVVWYRDWSLDRGGADGCYASAKSLSASLGGSVSPGSVETIRQRLKRLGLHQSVTRTEGRQVGWIATLPAECRALNVREAADRALVLDRYIEQCDHWKTLGGSRTHVPDKQNSGSTSLAPAASGGVGGVPSPELSETQLPSQPTSSEKGVRSRERKQEKGGTDPTHVGEILDRWRTGT